MHERLAIINGCRTPQAKAFGALQDVTAVELGVHALQSTVERAGIPLERVEEVIFGNVSGPADSANIARVIALQAGVPHSRIAHTVNRNCASGMEAILAGWQALQEGRSQLAVVGGTESMSNIPLLVRKTTQQKLMALARAKTLAQRVSGWSRFRARDFRPIAGVELGLTDPTCGMNMGQTAEVLVEEFGLNRLEQDEFALHSHQNACSESAQHFLSGEIEPIQIEGDRLKRDTGPRPNQSLDQLSKLRPIFKNHGTVTAGNSCPLTDGAATMLVALESQALEYCRQPMGFVTDYAIAGCDPKRMGLGPVYAVASLLNRNHLKLSDIDLLEINEAFAAQVLACLRAFESDSFARKELGASAAIGQIDLNKLNVSGGAIALGHPVGTTGARLTLTMARLLDTRELRRGIVSLCVGGGQGFAMLIESK